MAGVHVVSVHYGAGFANVISSGDSDGRQAEAQQDRADVGDVITGPRKWHLPCDERNYDVLRRHYFQLECRHSQIPDAVVKFRAWREAERRVRPRAASRHRHATTTTAHLRRARLSPLNPLALKTHTLIRLALGRSRGRVVAVT